MFSELYNDHSNMWNAAKYSLDTVYRNRFSVCL